jgi:teichuronic acid biosynthesis glycosyltransferase TuaG
MSGSNNTSSSPSISVVIPDYNSAFLEEAVASAYAQTVASSKVIVVNDGSTDDTEARLSRLSSSLPDSFVWRTKPNGGAASARNFGLQLVTGNYVAFLDSDDIWHPTKLQRHLEHFASDPDLALSFTGYDFAYVDASARPPRPPVIHHEHWDPDPEVVLEELLFRTCAAGTMSTVMIRREALARVTPFDERLTITDDHQMYLEVAVRRLKMDYLPGVLVKKRVHSDNISRDNAAIREDICQMYDRFFDDHTSELPEHIQERADKLRAHWHLVTAIDAIQRGDKARARRHLLSAARRRPRSIRPGWVRMLGVGPPP